MLYISPFDHAVSDNSNYLALVYFYPIVEARFFFQRTLYKVMPGLIERRDERGELQWQLRSWNTSSENIRYCYLGDLGEIASEDDLRYFWVHNVQPQGQEDIRALRRDFYCEFNSYPKEDLFYVLRRLSKVEILIGEERLTIWKPKEDLEEMCNEVDIPATDEYRQYRDIFLLSLARLVIEGFNKENLDKWAKFLGCKYEEKCKELNILYECLKMVASPEEAKRAIDPLKRLHKEKSARSSHGGKEPVSGVVALSEESLKDVISALTRIERLISISKGAACSFEIGNQIYEW